MKQREKTMNEIPEHLMPDPLANNGHHDADSETLRQYAKNKFKLAAQLRALSEIFNHRGNESRAEQCEELMTKLAEDRFTLAVLGQFKRGKSSLMNAVVGHELLPVGVLPLTSAITVLRFGPKERLLIRRENDSLPFQEEFPVKKLAEFVTEEGNPGNCRHIKTATIETPIPFLRRGLEFVDTPGIGSAIEANTKTTLKFLPECDAVLFVTSVDSPFSQAELDLLEKIRHHVHKIFFVINRIDLLAAAERQEVLDFVRGLICKQMGTDAIKIFPVSAHLGLESKVDGNWIDGLESGLRELENELVRFLSSEKTSLFLSAIIRRSLWLLEQEKFEEGLIAQANKLPENALVEQLGAVAAQLESHQVARRQIFDRLRQRILSQVEVILMPELLTVVRSEIDNFVSNVEEVLGGLTWCPLRNAWDRAAESASERACKNIRQWLSEQTDKFSFNSDEIACNEWKKIQSNLANIPAEVGKTMGLNSRADNSTEMLPPWRLQTKFELPFALNLRRLASIPTWPSVLPNFLTRKWLKKHLQAQHKEMEAKWQDAVIGYAAESVLKTIDELAKDVERQAGEAGLRVTAALRNNSFSPEDASNLQALDMIRSQLLTLRQEIAPDHHSCLDDGDNRNSATGQPPRASTSLPSNGLEAVRINFAADLKTRNCPTCNYLSHVAFHFLANFQWDLIRNRETQSKFAMELGFCPLHTWQLEAVSSPLGASIGLVNLAEHISKVLAEKRDALAHGDRNGDLSFKRNSCRVCRLLLEAEQTYLQKLAEFVEQQNGRTAYVGSQGLCLRHLDVWLPYLSNESAQFVLRHASVCFEEMAEDMQSFSLKTEALRRGLNNSDEEEAYLRTIIHLVGTRGNCTPMSKEAEI